jgi:hypothetical protein
MLLRAAAMAVFCHDPILVPQEFRLVNGSVSPQAGANGPPQW